MKFLAPLLHTKPSALQIVDMAYIVVLLPLLLMLKVPMILFSLMVVGLLFFKQRPAGTGLTVFVFIMGLLALYLSMYGAFNFSGLSRLKLFLELLVYILIVVVSMQRLTQKINFYLLISPFLFLALSLFFYHGIVMLSYVIFTIFFLLWMILTHRMHADLIESFRSTMVMFLYSLPWVVILFIFFPRISFEHADYGFKAETVQRMGHDGTMFIDGHALNVPSNRIVMEMSFEEKMPKNNTLYLRGSILYVDKKDHWEPLSKYVKRASKSYYPTKGSLIHYKVTLYPTQKRWLYLLDMPQQRVTDTELDRDLITTVKKNIDAPIHYSAVSSLSAHYADVLDDVTFKAASYYSKTQNPKSYAQAQKIKSTTQGAMKRADALVHLFKTQKLSYSLHPELLDINHSTDSFLFEKRRGYCVHFASSFVTMARMLDIPARVVTGYKADISESLNNYLAVKEKNAHAWAELYLDKQWVRYETTSTASNVDWQQNTLASVAQEKKKENALLKKINLYLMYTKYKIETWILYYSHVRQLQLLNYAKKNPTFVLVFVLSLIALILVSFTLVAYFKRPRYSSQALALMQPLLKKLKKEGYTRKENESMHQYLLRIHTQNPHYALLLKIDKSYETILYAKETSKAQHKQLKQWIKMFR